MWNSQKCFFISLQKLFSFSRRSSCRILNIQISWRHQMSKHKTRKLFYWITWKINNLLMKFGQFMSYYKVKKIIQKFYKNCNLKTSSSSFCVCKELSITSIGKWNFWNKLLIITSKQAFNNYLGNSKTNKICPNQHTDFLGFSFKEDSLKN